MGETDPRKMGFKGIRNYKAREQNGRCYCCGDEMTPKAGKKNTCAGMLVDLYAPPEISEFDNTVAACVSCANLRDDYDKLGITLTVQQLIDRMDRLSINGCYAEVRRMQEACEAKSAHDLNDLVDTGAK